MPTPTAVPQRRICPTAGARGGGTAHPLQQARLHHGDIHRAIGQRGAQGITGLRLAHAGHRLALRVGEQRMRHALLLQMQQLAQSQQALEADLPEKLHRRLALHADRLDRAALRLQLLDPRLVLQRGYALLTNTQGQAVTSVCQAQPGDALRATLADGAVDVTVVQPRLL